MAYGEILARLRAEKGYTQSEVAEYISRFTKKASSFKSVSHWETGVSSPTVEQFLLLCEFYGVDDIQSTFRGIDNEYRNLHKLNALGKSRVEEYIALLSANPLFAELENDEQVELSRRIIRLYDIPVAAGSGMFLDGESYTEFEVDETVPDDADFAVKVSGDSMEPRFIDGQIIFIREQQTLEIGEIGIFELRGDAYVKKLGHGELISLNPSYAPIVIGEFDSFRVFGRVVG